MSQPPILKSTHPHSVGTKNKEKHEKLFLDFVSLYLTKPFNQKWKISGNFWISEKFVQGSAVSEYFLFNPFILNAPFLYPWKHKKT